MKLEVGARRFTQVAFGLLRLQLSSKVTNSVWRSDWKLTTPVTQFAPTEGSPAPRPRYSTVVKPELRAVPGTSTPGGSKFSNPILGPVSWGAGGIGGAVEVRVTVKGMPPRPIVQFGHVPPVLGIPSSMPVTAPPAVTATAPFHLVSVWVPTGTPRWLRFAIIVIVPSGVKLLAGLAGKVEAAKRPSTAPLLLAPAM